MRSRLLIARSNGICVAGGSQLTINRRMKPDLKQIWTTPSIAGSKNSMHDKTRWIGHEQEADSIHGWNLDAFYCRHLQLRPERREANVATKDPPQRITSLCSLYCLLLYLPSKDHSYSSLNTSLLLLHQLLQPLLETGFLNEWFIPMMETSSNRRHLSQLSSDPFYNSIILR